MVAEGGYEVKVFIKVEDLKAWLFTNGNVAGERKIIDDGRKRAN